MSVSVLPNGKSQFIDVNGAPLVGGFVYHYVLDTDTPKDTYQDIDGEILNSNPIVLDERGQAAIWGTGNYRQRVLDSLGNEIWDVATSAMCECSDGGGGGGTSSYYEVSLYWPLDIEADEVVLLWNFAQAVSFDDNFSGFVPRIITAPASDIELTVTRIAADDSTDDIATITITSAGVITAVTTATPEFEAGGAMKITGPVDAQGAAGLAITFIGFPVA
jgi:hypothetical protein